jgi:hypothetical protein
MVFQARVVSIYEAKEAQKQLTENIRMTSCDRW